MDAKKFDELTQELAAGTSRRKALKGLLALAVGGLFGSRFDSYAHPQSPARSGSRLPSPKPPTPSESEEFHIVVQRRGVEKRSGTSRGKPVTGMRVNGTISVNGEVIGETFENDDVKVTAGSYVGLMRYLSGRGYVQGPLGKYGQKGDFLIEVSDVTWPDGKKRTDILLHGGSEPWHSLGCILLKRWVEPGNTVPQDHPLRKLRLLFYGTETPNSSPDKKITIDIIDFDPNEVFCKSIRETPCGDKCCPEGKVCGDGNVCQDPPKVDKAVCKANGETPCGETCCPVGQVCLEGKVCCMEWQTLVDGRCVGCSDRKPMCGDTCCSAGEHCCDGLCCSVPCENGTCPTLNWECTAGTTRWGNSCCRNSEKKCSSGTSKWCCALVCGTEPYTCI